MMSRRYLVTNLDEIQRPCLFVLSSFRHCEYHERMIYGISISAMGIRRSGKTKENKPEGDFGSCYKECPPVEHHLSIVAEELEYQLEYSDGGASAQWAMVKRA